jgi:hypothetical protein
VIVIELWLSEVVHDDDIMQLVIDENDDENVDKMVVLVGMGLLEHEVHKLDTVAEVMFEQINLMVEMVVVVLDMDDEVDDGEGMDQNEIALEYATTRGLDDEVDM